MRILIYSAEFGSYEHEVNQPIKPKLRQDVIYSYVRYSDRPSTKSKEGMWHHREPLQSSKELIDKPQYRARYHKMDPLGLMHEAVDYTLWVDASMSLIVDPMELIELMGDNDLMTFQHRHRTTILEEGQTVVKIKQQDPRVITNQINYYSQEGYRNDVALPETGLLLRRVNDKIRAFNAFWYSQILAFSVRDQMSFGYSAWKTGIKVGFFPGHVRSQRYNILHKHRSQR